MRNRSDNVAHEIYSVYHASAMTRIMFMIVGSPPLLMTIVYNIGGRPPRADEYVASIGTIMLLQALFMGYRVRIGKSHIEYRDWLWRTRKMEWLSIERAWYGRPQKSGAGGGWDNICIRSAQSTDSSVMAINTKPFSIDAYRHIARAIHENAPMAKIDKALMAAQKDGRPANGPALKDKVLSIITTILCIAMVVSLIKLLLQ